MTVASPGRNKYVYIHEDHDGPLQEIDVHHILAQKNSTKNSLRCIALILLLAHMCCLMLLKERPGAFFLWNILLVAIVAKALLQASIMKESVVIMRGFGLQLETHFRSGRVVRRFVPFGKVLKAVLNECVTPVTCYWSLALIVRDEPELLLVFQELRLPVKLLVPIWKALRVAIDSKEITDTVKENNY
ncbi:hypothetical protein GIB67_026815 [Kingdonia uniflora]|uniref:Phosphatidylinositol N-acetylglucosaminyltransferase subunit H conserved domain-containing protein n=1 Tax=Kingdonia uniflora TaxID=39325 RepID=A0A7J7MHG5_9MAGN|nr:hypothetical protein GIB67_026815 [Kingdonia uniflora]